MKIDKSIENDRLEEIFRMVIDRIKKQETIIQKLSENLNDY